METPTERGAHPPLMESIRLPDTIEPGRYDAYGRKDPEGNFFLGMGSGIVHMWGAFHDKLAPGQHGIMTFTNVPGSYALTGNFTEWLPGPIGYSPHAVPRKEVGSALGVLPQQIEEGTWDITIRVFDVGPNQPPEIVQGVETNVLMPTMQTDPTIPASLWYVSSYKAIFHGAPFEQHGIVGYDPNQEKFPYVAAWVKSVQANLAVFQGSYDEISNTLTMIGQARSCFGDKGSDGKVLLAKEARITRYLSRTLKHFRVYQSMPDEDDKYADWPSVLPDDEAEWDPLLTSMGWLRRDQSVGVKRQPVSGANVPTVGAALMRLLSLQRGHGSARVVGENAGSSAVHAAAGIVMLGPVWINLFGQYLRLD